MLKIIGFSCALIFTDAIGSLANAQPMGPQSSCQAQFSSLMAQWDGIGFATPSKPGQAVVLGSHGYRTSGSEFGYMTSQIRAAHAACERGDAQLALQHIGAVRELLAHAAQLNG